MGERLHSPGGNAGAPRDREAGQASGPLQRLVERFGAAGAQRIVQRKVSQRRGEPPTEVNAAADEGLAGAGGQLPHLEKIQQAFGRHDVRGVQAHTDEAAARGAGAMGAEAFAAGDHVAFAGAPSLHTAAHEAAHVVQQRRGVHLKGGVGAAGDEYERHADAVADAVVSGRSAQALLDRHGGGGGGDRHAVQHIKKAELSAMGQRIGKMAETAPESGMNVWEAKLTVEGGTATLFLLGTQHGLNLSDMEAVKPLVDFLQQESFTQVYSEIPAVLPHIDSDPDLSAKLAEKHDKVKAFERKYPKEPETGQERRQYLIEKQKIAQLDAGGVGDLDRQGLDNAFVHLATTDAKGGKRASAAALEDEDSRKQAREQNDRDETPNAAPNDDGKKVDAKHAAGQKAVKEGNQKAIFEEQAEELTAGLDVAAAEERNKRWIEKAALPANMKPGDKQLWIVGAAHLPGLIVRLQDLKWAVSHRGPVAAQPKKEEEAAASSSSPPPSSSPSTAATGGASTTVVVSGGAPTSGLDEVD
jgi:hypothetical protein